MSEATRKEEVTTLGRKLNEARVGKAEKWPSALDMHLAVVALNHVAEASEYEYNIRDSDGDVFYSTWGDKALMEQMLFKRQSGIFADPKDCLVKRRKPGPVEDA